MSTPRATLRLQFNRAFTLADAAAAVPAFAALGVSHLYASPLQRARSGSTHGYDVVDYDAIAPDLGGLDGLRRLVARLRRHGLGLVLDIVPNHMATSEENAWWFDVLEHGPASGHATFFDIDWDSPDPALRGKVLAPFLASPLDDALARVALRLDAGRPLLEVDGRRYPLASETIALVLDAPPRRAAPAATEAALARFNALARRRPARLRELLDGQHYRLAYWRKAASRINWRRFFDITDLIALRIDRNEVFDAVHRFVFELYAQALIDGVRVDHVDGLADPRAYCARLRAGLEAAAERRRGDAAAARAYVVVEKILRADEVLPPAWDVDGTTGYDFMDQCTAVLHEAHGAAALDALWCALGGAADFAKDYAQPARRELLAGAFAADLERLLRAGNRLRLVGVETAADDRDGAIALLAHFDAYRTYLEPGRVEPADRARLLAAAAAGGTPAEAPARRFAGTLLAAAEAPRARDAAARLLRAFQQLTPALAAKALEDTAFYRYGRLLSRNEVGADPARLALSRAGFHAACAARRAAAPDAMLALATHDHKRGADVRARLAVLSELPYEWAALVAAARRLNAPLRAAAHGREAPEATDEAMLLQTLVGAWPLQLDAVEAGDAARLAAFTERIALWQRKALREAKRRTSWTDPDLGYEAACERYLRAVLAPASAFRPHLARFVERIAAAGALNGLAQAVLHLTVPGVPDLYQGTDYWDFSLVDPDNRAAPERPAGAALEVASIDPADWRSGRLKHDLVVALLRARAQQPDLFARGDYRALATRGPLQRRLLAFARTHADGTLVVVVTRLAARWLDAAPWIPPMRWRDTRLAAPAGCYVDVLGGRRIEAAGGTLAAAELLSALPVAVLLQRRDRDAHGMRAP